LQKDPIAAGPLMIPRDRLLPESELGIARRAATITP
jgi:hypothetical protein